MTFVNQITLASILSDIASTLGICSFQPRVDRAFTDTRQNRTIALTNRCLQHYTVPPASESTCRTATRRTCRGTDSRTDILAQLGEKQLPYFTGSTLEQDVKKKLLSLQYGRRGSAVMYI